MTQILKQSTAVDVLIGPFLDLTDAATAETGESPSVKLSKNGQALSAKNDVTTPVSDADGYYNCELDATDTNTVGTLVLSVAKSATALPVRHEYQVIEEAIYDALYGASAAGFDANQRVDVGKWLGTAVTTSATTAKPEVDVNSISDDATAANNAELMFDGTGYAGGTTKLDVNLASMDDIDLSATMKASVNTEADNAIVTYGLDHLVSAAVVGTDVTDNSIVAKLVDDAATADWDNYDPATASLEALNVDTDAIKAKTDDLTYTVAGDVDVNIQSIGGAALSTTTAQIGANVVQISGDATAADRLEGMMDGILICQVNHE